MRPFRFLFRFSRPGSLKATLVALLLCSSPALAAPKFVATEPQALPTTPDLLTLDNETDNLAGRTGRVLLVNVWATWCRPCLEELPALNRLHERMDSSEIDMIALNYGDSLSNVRSFLDRTEIQFEVLLDATTQYASQFPMKGLPTTFLVDKQGRIRYRLEGLAQWGSDEMLAEIRQRQQEMAIDP